MRPRLRNSGLPSRGQPAEVVGELVRPPVGELPEAAHPGPRPPRSFGAAPALPAFGVAMDEPRALRYSQPLHRGRIPRGTSHALLAAHFRDERAVDPREARVRGGKERAEAFVLVLESR